MLVSEGCVCFGIGGLGSVWLPFCKVVYGQCDNSRNKETNKEAMLA